MAVLAAVKITGSQAPVIGFTIDQVDTIIFIKSKTRNYGIRVWGSVCL